MYVSDFCVKFTNLVNLLIQLIFLNLHTHFVRNFFRKVYYLYNQF